MEPIGSETSITYSITQSLEVLERLEQQEKSQFLNILENLLMKVLTLCKVQKRVEEAEAYVESIRVLIAEYRGLS